jgi:hypothetical protein
MSSSPIPRRVFDAAVAALYLDPSPRGRVRPGGEWQSGVRLRPGSRRASSVGHGHLLRERCALGTGIAP